MGYWTVLHKLDGLARLDVNPDRISWLAVVLSAVFIFSRDLYVLTGALALVILLDWLDGAVARNMNKKGRKLGEATDVGCDRVSELMVFSAYPLLLPLVVINIFLSAQKLRVNLPIVLPLRHLMLLYLVGVLAGVLPDLQQALVLWQG